MSKHATRRLGYLVNPDRFGYQPPGRDARNGRLKHCRIGCRTSGGTLPPRLCEKCRSAVSDTFRELLRRGYRQAG